jgi:hypothetical protein
LEDLDIDDVNLVNQLIQDQIVKDGKVTLEKAEKNSSHTPSAIGSSSSSSSSSSSTLNDDLNSVLEDVQF